MNGGDAGRPGAPEDAVRCCVCPQVEAEGQRAPPLPLWKGLTWQFFRTNGNTPLISHPRPAVNCSVTCLLALRGSVQIIGLEGEG